MKRIAKNAACVLLWVSLSVGALWLMNRVLVVKNTDGVTAMQNFYAQEKDTVDVLLLGSSHCGMNLNTGTLWDEYGMASYALWGSLQPFWGSYHFLVEGLKTQSPKAVVLEVYAATFEETSMQTGTQVVNTAGMKLSRNKWEAVKVSAPKTQWLDLFFGLPLYHERVGELTQEDYQHFPWTKGLIEQKGGALSYGSQQLVSFTDVSDVTEVKALQPQEEEYLRRIIELCQEKEIPILLLKTPVRGDWQRDQQPYYNRVAEIAREYGVPFCDQNLLWEELGFDTADYGFDNHHLNARGAGKASRRMAQELLALCDIPDRRGDPAYESWEISAQRIRNPQLSVFRDTQSFVEELLRRDCALFVATTGALENTGTSTLAPLGIPDFPPDCAKAWFLSSTQGGSWVEAERDGSLFRVNADGFDIVARVENWTWLMAKGVEVTDEKESDVLLAVLDTQTGKILDVVRLGNYTSRLLDRVM